MASERYSFSLTTFRYAWIEHWCGGQWINSLFLSHISPSGKLVQIEYALAAVGAGAPAVGIKGNTFFFVGFIF